MLPPLRLPGAALADLTLATAPQMPLTQDEIIIALAAAVPCLLFVFFALTRITKALSLPLTRIAQTVPGGRQLYRLQGQVHCPEALQSRIDSQTCHHERIDLCSVHPMEDIDFLKTRRNKVEVEHIFVGTLGENHAKGITFEDDTGALPILLHEMTEGVTHRLFDPDKDLLPAVIADAHQAFVAQRIAKQGFADFPKIILSERLIKLPTQLTLWARRERVRAPDGSQQDFLIAERVGDYESALNLKINLAIVFIFGAPLFFILLGILGQIPPDTVRAVGETCWDIFAATITAIFR